jgi:hypothetical protein
MDPKEFEAELRKWLASETATIANIADRKLLRAMFYGDFGSGKTSLAGQIVKACGGRGMLFYTDSNYVVIQKDPEAAKLIDAKPFENYTQLKVFAHGATTGVEGFNQYDWLILDTASTAVYEILRILVKGIKFEDQRHPELESWSHYNLVRAKSLEMIRELNKSNLNIIYLCHDQDPSKQEKEKDVVKHFAARPNMPEKTYNIYAGEVSLLGWLAKADDGQNRTVNFQGTLRRAGKSQILGIDEKQYLVDEIPELVKKWKEQ